MKTKKFKAVKWYNHRRYALVIGVLALGLCYAVASRAIDTGSLQQYFLFLILLGVALNRFMHILLSFLPSKGK